MTNSNLDKLTWVLIYVGLLLLCLSIFVLRGDASLGWTLLGAGGAMAAAGVLCAWLRSRRGP